MIKQTYFCDKCKKEIVEGEYMFKCQDLDIYQITKGYEQRLDSHFSHLSRYNKECYCIKCIQTFFVVPSKKDLKGMAESNKNHYKKYFEKKEILAPKIKSIREE